MRQDKLRTSSFIQQAVILAGGQGTRLRPLTLTIPKPMIPFHGKPFLEYLISDLRKNNIKDIIILVGYLHGKIEKYFGDGKRFGLHIRYSYSPVEADTGTRLRNARNLIKNEFLLLYGDNYWPLELPRLVDYYKKLRMAGIVTVYSNWDNYTKNNIFVNSDGIVTVYDRRRKRTDLNGVDIGYFIFNKHVLSLIPKKNSSFEEHVLSKLVRNGDLGGFITHTRYYGLSRPERMAEISDFFKPKKAIFLDRDGVINRRAPKATYITSWQAFHFLPGVKKALKQLEERGYQIFIITNQSGIARNMMKPKDLDMIHKNMMLELKKVGVHIKHIYVCPHGWNEGCFCRKPNPGLLLRAGVENKLDLREIFYIGDDERDVLAGKSAGCRTVFIKNKNSNKVKLYETNVRPDIIAKSLADSVHRILMYTV